MFISQQANENLSTQSWEGMYGQSFPKLRFFRPTPIFWKYLREVMDTYDINMFIDCGTGNGDLPLEARLEHGIKMAGVDIIHREGNGPTDVQIMPAHRLPYSPSIWAMVCRPDHGGWAKALLIKTIKESSGFIYVGLRKNMALDLGDAMMELNYKTYENVGVEGEEMLVFHP